MFSKPHWSWGGGMLKMLKKCIRSCVHFPSAFKTYLKQKKKEKDIASYFKSLKSNPNTTIFENYKNDPFYQNKCLFIDGGVYFQNMPIIIRKEGVLEHELIKSFKDNNVLVHSGHINEGYKFIYGLKPDYLLLDKDGHPIAFLQNKMSSEAMSVKKFMPFDPLIWQYVNANGITDDILYLLRLMKCMFSKENGVKPFFSNADIEYFDANSHLLSDSFFEDNKASMIYKVFFDFTPCLLQMLKKKQYSEINEAFRRYEY